jgi:hypothetical protein
MSKHSPDTSRRRPVSRRDFLAVGGLSVVGLSVGERAARLRAELGRGPKTVVMVLMNGGASQLETFDPKPAAPKEIRGPYRAIETTVPGMQLSELLPRLAERAKHFSLIRTLHHQGSPIHETGLGYLQGGATATRLLRPAALGTVLQYRSGFPGDSTVPAYVVTPARFAINGHGPLPFDGVGDLDKAHPPAVVDDGLIECGPSIEQSARAFPGRFQEAPDDVRDAYGRTRFGKCLWNARQLVEYGASWITVNLFDHLEGAATWDAHGAATAPATMADYGRTLCPQFDRALSAFFDDLQTTGLWNDVLVVCTGEMGRNPRINPRGGRDHWTRCWSALIAGGGTPGGQIIGDSNAQGAEPVDRPVHVRDLAAFAFAEASSLATTDDLPQLTSALPLPELSPAVRKRPRRTS